MIQRWDIITIGNLSRNRYWGERDDQAYRPALCTSTLVTSDGCRLLVDPSCGEYAQMITELDRRTGLTPEAIDVIFLTHEHGDHHAGLRHFPLARWLAAPGVASAINASGDYSQAVVPVTGEIIPGIEMLPTPGHAPAHHSLIFKCDGRAVVIAGDAVMTRDFWMARQGFHNSADFLQVLQNMALLEVTADIIIPGHDNYFLLPAITGKGER